MKRFYSVAGLAGCVEQRRNRVTKLLVGVYNSEQAGLDDDPSCKWSTVCEQHHNLVGHSSLYAARINASTPWEWCEDCRDLGDP
jgi:hypothetical protein